MYIVYIIIIHHLPYYKSYSIKHLLIIHVYLHRP